jgi:hypothetical protein
LVGDQLTASDERLQLCQRLPAEFWQSPNRKRSFYLAHLRAEITAVRKQIYIQKRQDALLKRLDQARGLSEAEIIRQAIEREVAGEGRSADFRLEDWS